MLSQERLKELLSYDCDTGVFTHKLSRGGRVKAGGIAGYVRTDGYIYIRVDRIQYLAHRLVWLYVEGCWPTDLVDHRDGSKINNRRENLREATPSQNSQNVGKASSNSTTGFLGVSKIPGERFRAVIKTDRKQKSLGCFKTAEEAHSAYLKAKSELHKFSNRIQA